VNRDPQPHSLVARMHKTSTNGVSLPLVWVEDHANYANNNNDFGSTSAEALECRTWRKNRPPKGKGRPVWFGSLDKDWVPSMSGGSMTANQFEQGIATFPAADLSYSSETNMSTVAQRSQTNRPSRYTIHTYKNGGLT
jgi:hypothetical protein